MKSGIPPALEPVAAIGGRELIDGVGLFITGGAFWSGARAKLASVPMLDADMLRAGDAGLTGAENGEGEGLSCGGLLEIDDLRGRGSNGGGGATEFAEVAVGVACGVEAAELALLTEIGAGVCFSLLAEGW